MTPEATAFLELLQQRELGDKTPLVVSPRMTVHHGTPKECIDTMLKNLCPYEHDMLGGDWFCVSPNDNVLRIFGEGGTHGLIATVEFENLLVLSKLAEASIFHLISGDNQTLEGFDGTLPHEKAVTKLEEFFETKNLDWWRVKKEHLEEAWRKLQPTIDGIIWNNCWKTLRYSFGNNLEYNYQEANLEAEISLSPKGCQKFRENLIYVVRDGDWDEWYETTKNEHAHLLSAN